MRVRPLKPIRRNTSSPDPVEGFVALSLLTAPNRAPMTDSDDGPPCHLCTARCCKYFAFEIDTPTTKRDYDYIRWYLMHEAIVVWVQDQDWYIEIRTVCKHLQPDHTCGIYDSRPKVCRDYGAPGEPCEYFTDDLEYDLFFDSDTKFDAWTQTQLAKKQKKRTKKNRQNM